MNFLLHRELAERSLASSAAGCGAMLPDLWRIADRRVRPGRFEGEIAVADGEAALSEVLAGIRHHLESDSWFHGATVFTEGERRTAERFRRAELVAPRMGLLAHATWELCLDGALVRRRGVPSIVESVREAFAAAAQAAERAARLCHFDPVGRTEDEWLAFSSRMRSIERRLVGEQADGEAKDSRWIAAYASGTGLAEVLDHLRTRLGLAGLGERDRGRVAQACEELLHEADGALDEVLDLKSVPRGEHSPRGQGRRRRGA